MIPTGSRQNHIPPMSKSRRPTAQTTAIRLIRRGASGLGLLARWLVLVVPMGVAVGSASALFLWSLDRVTRIRFDHPWLLYLLPAGGWLVALAYQKLGGKSEGGTNLLIDEIHEPGGGVPRRMAPLILAGTLLTHLFGGSAGREGTAVQMGGSLASTFARLLRVPPRELRMLLMAGVAAGFGAVFGTPLAGTVFALEVLVAGRIRHEALLPCLAAACVGNWTCEAWGTLHSHYRISFVIQEPGLPAAAGLLARILLAGAIFGLCAALFARASHGLAGFFRKVCPNPALRPVIGGLGVIALVHLLGTREFLGLGVWSPNTGDLTIGSFFEPGRIVEWAWFWKLLFTVLTLSSGFKGGEVTPLFFIGAALGSAVSGVIGGPSDLFAALGFVAVFAAAAKTPLACTLMGIELFGTGHAVHLAIACCVAYACSGPSGIYRAQRAPGDAP